MLGATFDVLLESRAASRPLVGRSPYLQAVHLMPMRRTSANRPRLRRCHWRQFAFGPYCLWRASNSLLRMKVLWRRGGFQPRRMTGRVGKQLADARDGAADNLIVAFDDDRLLTTVFGEHVEHLASSNSASGDRYARGNRVALSGNAAMRERARQILQHLYLRASRGHDVNAGDVTGAIRMTESAVSDEADAAAVRTRKKTVVPRSPRQRAYVEAIGRNDLVFGTGPAGTGKTYLAVACAAADWSRPPSTASPCPAGRGSWRTAGLSAGRCEGEGRFLPRPCYDALYDVVPAPRGARARRRNLRDRSACLHARPHPGLGLHHSR